MDWDALVQQGVEAVEAAGGPQKVGAMLLGAYLVPKVVMPLIAAASVPKIDVPVTAQESAVLLNAELYVRSRLKLFSGALCESLAPGSDTLDRTI